MKTIVAGSREWKDYTLLAQILDKHNDITEVVSGGAKGADRMGERWARSRGVPVKMFLPDYRSFGARVAPIMRNREMAAYGERLIAFWDGKSNGTRNMIGEARACGLPVMLIQPQ